jgi:hypothetical protein
MPFTSRERSPSGLPLPIITRENPATFDQGDEFTKRRCIHKYVVGAISACLLGKSGHNVEKLVDYSGSSAEVGPSNSMASGSSANARAMRHANERRPI